MKKVFVLRIGDYRPDLCQFTIPTIKAYAEKIGAEYFEITQRRFPDFPITCEKLQIYTLGENSDWNILVDADVMIRPDMPDVTQYLPPNAVATAFAFDADYMFKTNKYFERDGRNIGLVANFVVSTKLTHDVWCENLGDISWFQAREETRREFILDEYILSRNLAKYGLKHSGILPMPQLSQMIIHHGSEERSDLERTLDAQNAEGWYAEWQAKFPGVLK